MRGTIWCADQIACISAVRYAPGQLDSVFSMIYGLAAHRELCHKRIDVDAFNETTVNQVIPSNGSPLPEHFEFCQGTLLISTNKPRRVAI